jgi:hypothetical protein
MSNFRAFWVILTQNVVQYQCYLKNISLHKTASFEPLSASVRRAVRVLRKLRKCTLDVIFHVCVRHHRAIDFDHFWLTTRSRRRYRSKFYVIQLEGFDLRGWSNLGSLAGKRYRPYHTGNFRLVPIAILYPFFSHQMHA